MATTTSNLTWSGALDAVTSVGKAIGDVGSAITSGINATSSITGLLYADAAASRQEAAAYSSRACIKSRLPTRCGLPRFALTKTVNTHRSRLAGNCRRRSKPR